MRFPQSRDFYTPKGDGLTVQAFDDVATIVYLTERTTGEGKVRFIAMGFAGKAAKPSFHYSFADEIRRQTYIDGFVKARRSVLDRKAAAAAERRAFRHTLKVGDVLQAMWGYDQTNIDYYQVTALKGKKQVLARRIHAVSEETGNMCGRCGPDVGNFIERYPEKAYLVQEGNRIKVASYASASPVACQQVGPLKIYETAQWTSYA